MGQTNPCQPVTPLATPARLADSMRTYISGAITPEYGGCVDIRAERAASGLTQSQLAQAAGVPQPNLSAYENGRRTPSPEVEARIRGALRVPVARRIDLHRPEITALVAAHQAREPRIFGSVARGDSGPDSDVDLLVEFTDEATLLDEVGLRLALTDLLQAEVDVVGLDTLRGPLRERVLREAVPV